MNNEKFKQFQADLNRLIEKYDAFIYWTCGPDSDTYGIYDEKLMVEIQGVPFVLNDEDGRYP